jgi:multimeric flavodoxin WrbA
MTESPQLRALALVCSLKASPAPSSSDLMARQILEQMGRHGITGDVVRVVDHDVKPGVEVDMGEGDAWPAIREQLLAADILVVSTPTWVGHMSSVAQRVLERLDGELSETHESGRPLVTGKVAVTAVVGNEDGAHKITADLMQALDDVGFTIPSQGGTYWNDEAMGGRDYLDLVETPEAVASTTATLAENAAHLARLLKAAPYPRHLSAELRRRGTRPARPSGTPPGGRRAAAPAGRRR